MPKALVEYSGIWGSAVVFSEGLTGNADLLLILLKELYCEIP